MDDALGKLDITEEEATLLAIDGIEKEGVVRKWSSLAVQIIYRNPFHVQTITHALRPARGNPRGFVFYLLQRACLLWISRLGENKIALRMGHRGTAARIL